MIITIVHLYYNLMNLYGESGNIKALKNCFEQLNIKVKIKFITLDEKIDLTDTDLLYIGMGTEENQILILDHLKKYKKEIEEYIENNGLVLSTGNSLDLFGKKIKDSLDYETLGIFDYETSRCQKIVSEALYRFSELDDYVLGFTNRRSNNNISANQLFSVVKGVGNNGQELKEGYHYKNFYGTYLIGPLLVRNPKLLKYFVNKIMENKDAQIALEEANLELEEEAYKEFLKNYYIEYVK